MLLQEIRKTEGDSEVIKSKDESNSSKLYDGLLCQSTMIPNYIFDKEDAEYDDLSNEISADISLGHSQIISDSTYIKQSKAKKPIESLGRTVKPSVNTLFGPDPLDSVENQLNTDKVGIGSLLKNKMANAFSIFGDKIKTKEIQSSSEDSSDEESEEEKPVKVLAEDDKESISIEQIDNIPKSLSKNDIIAKSENKLESDEKEKQKVIVTPKAPKKLKKIEFSRFEDAQKHLKQVLAKNHSCIKQMIDTQISKWESIQTKRENEQKLKLEIQDYEKEVMQATHNDDYDLAEQLQAKIDKTTKELEKNRDYRFELEEKTKEIKSIFLKDIKENISALIVTESKLESQKGIFHREETMRINDQNDEFIAQGLKLGTIEKDFTQKLEESKRNLKELEGKVSEKAKEHIDAKDVLEEKITVVDSEIAELERQLKLKIDEKHALEEEREEKIKIIKEITSDLDDQKFKEEVGKYERKLMVNSERKGDLLQEQEKLTESKIEFAEKIEDFDKKINQFSTLAKNLKERLKKQESEFDQFDSVIKEYERKLTITLHLQNIVFYSYSIKNV